MPRQGQGQGQGEAEIGGKSAASRELVRRLLVYATCSQCFTVRRSQGGTDVGKSAQSEDLMIAEIMAANPRMQYLPLIQPSVAQDRARFPCSCPFLLLLPNHVLISTAPHPMHDRPLDIAARAKVTKHQAACSNSNSTSLRDSRMWSSRAVVRPLP